MSDSNSTSNASTIGAVLIFIVLFILKVNPGGNLDSPVENWSWWLVTMPLWIGLAILAVVASVILLGVTIKHFSERHAFKKRVKRINASRNVR